VFRADAFEDVVIFESALHETESTTLESKIDLAKLASFERLVSPANIDRSEEDALFEAFDDIRAIEWQRLSHHEELISWGSLPISMHQ